MLPYGSPTQRRQPKIVRVLKSRTSTILIAALAVMLLYFLFSPKGFISRMNIENDIAEKEQRVIDLQRDIQRLSRKRDLLREDKATIEHVARESHGMIKPGEIVYRIVPADKRKR